MGFGFLSVHAMITLTLLGGTCFSDLELNRLQHIQNSLAHMTMHATKFCNNNNILTNRKNN